jgi:hypothetical protein
MFANFVAPRARCPFEQGAMLRIGISDHVRLLVRFDEVIE